MRRYILHMIGSYSGGYLLCTVDDLDDIIGDEEVEAIDTHTGNMYFYKDDVWVEKGNADEVQDSYLRRKSDPPPEPKPDLKEVDGGALIPKAYCDAIMLKQLDVTAIPISGSDLKIPFLEGNNGN